MPPRPRKLSQDPTGPTRLPWPLGHVDVRPARPGDVATLGRLGMGLARAHHDWDPARFFVPETGAKGYGAWLGKELRSRRAVVLVAVRERRTVGYAYGRLEPRDWNLLRDACGVVVDLMVAPGARGGGVGTLLLRGLLAALRERGAPSVVLQVASANRRAQRFFTAEGFRPTLMEMALEFPPPPQPKRTPEKPRRRDGR